MGTRPTVRIAVVGDVHLKWDEYDVEYFDDSDYDLVLFVGDLGNYRHKRCVQVAERISRLRVPALFMPGNHDAVLAPQLVAEVLQRPLAVEVLGLFGKRLSKDLRDALGGVTQCGYSLHRVADKGLSIIAGRPHAMGASQLSFAPLLRREYGIASLDDSRAQYRKLIDNAQDDRILFLAHNGPAGLGSDRAALWGCDFRAEAGDFGDSDLTDAITYAKSAGKRVVAVIAGHMHRRLRGGGERVWQQRADGVLYVNAAEVPRIRRKAGRVCHHHVRVIVDNPATAEDIWVPRSKTS